MQTKKTINSTNHSRKLLIGLISAFSQRILPNCILESVTRLCVVVAKEITFSCNSVLDGGCDVMGVDKWLFVLASIWGTALGVGWLLGYFEELFGCIGELHGCLESSMGFLKSVGS